ncbi:LptF/LptG family permease [Oryzibacter oryziterrae]|uniref:LptF/LptG family permease n=1 Tax=Oryzibacter oryziterrae TaxID=2766474 RepID=UPI001EFFF1D6|nr:LptF/LptG family permease [Oryzibacter oryziterrae]
MGVFLFTRVLAAFTGTLFTLVGIAWITQALRKFDLVTAKGQAIALYLGITLLLVPQIVAVVAPFAMVLALVIVLNQLHSESELVAMTAAGVSQRQLAKPFIAVSLVVSLVTAWAVMFGDPMALRSVRDIGNHIRADVVSNVIQPGQFSDIEDSFTFHIRDRLGDGSLQGLFIFDNRDPAYSYTYTANVGRIAQFGARTMVVMERGTVERVRRSDNAGTLVKFGSYAFDLSQLTPQNTAKSADIDESTIVDLLSRDAQTAGFSDATVAHEIANRVSTMLYPPLMTLIALLFLGYPKTTRTGRSLAVLSALFVPTLTRIFGLILAGISKNNPVVTQLLVPLPLLGIILVGAMLWFGLEPKLPTRWSEAAAVLKAGLASVVAKRFGKGGAAQ